MTPNGARTTHRAGLSRRTAAFVLTLLLIEFLDEFVFGAREAAWPLIRDDLGLTYASGLIGGLIPLALGLAAQQFGLAASMWLLLLGPLALLLGLPRSARVE